jgi:hypothetical protein
MKNGRPTREPLILRLPNELRSQIFAIAIAYDRNEFNLRIYKTALSLSIICRRFHSLVQPLLYKHILLGTFVGFVPPKLPAKRFYRTTLLFGYYASACTSTWILCDLTSRPTTSCSPMISYPGYGACEPYISTVVSTMQTHGRCCSTPYATCP